MAVEWVDEAKQLRYENPKYWVYEKLAHRFGVPVSLVHRHLNYSERRLHHLRAKMAAKRKHLSAEERAYIESYAKAWRAKRYEVQKEATRYNVPLRTAYQSAGVGQHWIIMLEEGLAINDHRDGDADDDTYGEAEVPEASFESGAAEEHSPVPAL